MAELVNGIAANLITVVLEPALVLLLFLVVRLPFVYRTRRRLFRFFGICETTQNLILYLSTVFVQRGGSVNFQTEPRSFAGPAIPVYELGVLENIFSLFGEPFLDGLPTRLRELLSKRIYWAFADIRPTVEASPFNKPEVKTGSIIAVGSQYYNSASALYIEKCAPFLNFEEDGQSMVIRVQRGSHKGDVFSKREGKQDDIAILEKLVDRESKSTVFITAGVGIYGTVGALNYLVINWKRLHEQYGVEPFSICIRFQDVLVDPNWKSKPVELGSFCS